MGAEKITYVDFHRKEVITPYVARRKALFRRWSLWILLGMAGTASLVWYWL